MPNGLRMQGLPPLQPRPEKRWERRRGLDFLGMEVPVEGASPSSGISGRSTLLCDRSTRAMDRSAGLADRSNGFVGPAIRRVDRSTGWVASTVVAFVPPAARSGRRAVCRWCEQSPNIQGQLHAGPRFSALRSRNS